MFQDSHEIDVELVVSVSANSFFTGALFVRTL